MIQKIDLNRVLSIRKEVMWPTETIDFVRVEGDEDAIHFGYFEDQVLVGVISVFQSNQSFQFRKLAVTVDHQGKGIGLLLVEFVKKYCLSLGGSNLWCNARIEKIGFYERLGFFPSGEIFFKNGKGYLISNLELK